MNLKDQDDRKYEDDFKKEDDLKTKKCLKKDGFKNQYDLTTYCMA